LHELSGGGDEKPIRVLAAHERVSDVFRVGNVDVDVVADLGFALFKRGVGDVDSPGVARVPDD
jgi:hypothetical protein